MSSYLISGLLICFTSHYSNCGCQMEQMCKDTQSTCITNLQKTWIKGCAFFFLLLGISTLHSTQAASQCDNRSKCGQRTYLVAYLHWLPQTWNAECRVQHGQKQTVQLVTSGGTWLCFPYCPDKFGPGWVREHYLASILNHCRQNLFASGV